MDKTAYFEQMRLRRRMEILEAARRMILDFGMEEFNIQQLARDLDISTVTLYKYFKNSSDIIHALKEQILDDNLDQLISFSTLCVADSSLETFLQTLNTFYSKAVSNRDDLTLLLLFDVHTRHRPPGDQSRSAFSPVLKQLETYLHTLLVNAQKEGELSKDLDVQASLQFISTMMMSLLQHIGLLSETAFEQEKDLLERNMDYLITLFRQSLTAGKK